MCHWKKQKTPFFGGQSMKDKFSTNAYLTRTILGIPRNQIKTKRVFSIVGILIGLCWCWLGAKNLDLLVLLIKNWPNDPIFLCL